MVMNENLIQHSHQGASAPKRPLGGGLKAQAGKTPGGKAVEPGSAAKGSTVRRALGDISNRGAGPSSEAAPGAAKKVAAAILSEAASSLDLPPVEHLHICEPAPPPLFDFSGIDVEGAADVVCARRPLSFAASCGPDGSPSVAGGMRFHVGASPRMPAPAATPVRRSAAAAAAAAAATPLGAGGTPGGGAPWELEFSLAGLSLAPPTPHAGSESGDEWSSPPPRAAAASPAAGEGEGGRDQQKRPPDFGWVS